MLYCILSHPNSKGRSICFLSAKKICATYMDSIFQICLQPNMHSVLNGKDYLQSPSGPKKSYVPIIEKSKWSVYQISKKHGIYLHTERMNFGTGKISTLLEISDFDIMRFNCIFITILYHFSGSSRSVHVRV